MTNEKKNNVEVKQIFVAVFICFFFSGVAGLIYQIIWRRWLSLVFGSTTFATSTVLAIFMGGLALGSFIFGRAADRIKRPLMGYALLQVGIGVYGLFIPFLLKLVQPMYLSVARSWEFSGFYNIFLFFLSALILILPAIFMGGTFPLISKFYIKRTAVIGKLVGHLYAVNTFGAVLGIVLAGFLFLPIFGMSNLNLFAAVISIGIGALCILFDRHSLALIGQEKLVREERTVTHKINYWGWIILIGFGFSGFASMIYEVAWARALALSIGSSIYAFSTMLVTFIFGIAVGSLIFSLFWKERKVPYYGFGLIEASIGIVVLLIMPLFDKLPTYFLTLFGLFPGSYGFVQFIQFFLCFLVMIIPALLFGASFPIVVRIFVEDFKVVGNRIGQVYAVNTLGCIIGSFLVGFALIPLIGAQWSIILAASVNILVAIVVFVSSREMRTQKKLIVSGVVVAISLLLILQTQSWNQIVLNTGITLRPGQYLKMKRFISLEEFVANNKILFYREGVNCNVAVVKVRNILSLNINGKSDASNGQDMVTQLLVAYLPLILHEDPQDVFILGLGSGITAGACVNYGVPNVECAEIEGAVIEAAEFFNKENHSVLSDERAKIIRADGRNYLLAAQKKYDVIINEPSNPWLAGLTNLFAKDYYEICRDKLKENGIICSWVQSYSLSPEDFQMAVNTFHSVFPYVTVWKAGRGNDYLMIGSLHEMEIDPNTIFSRMKRQGVKEDLNSVGIDNQFAILSLLVLSTEAVGDFVQGGLINSDDFPIIEFSAPKSLYAQTNIINDKYVLLFGKPVFSDLPEQERAWIHYYRGAYAMNMSRAMTEFQKAIELDPSLYLIYFRRGIAYRDAGMILKAIDDFLTARSMNPNDADIYAALGKTYSLQEKNAEGIKNFRKAIKMEPDNKEYRFDLVNVLIKQQDYKEALFECEKLLALDSLLNSKVFEMMGSCKYMIGDTTSAIQYLEKAVSVDEDNDNAHYRLAKLHMAAGNNYKALYYIQKTLELTPLRIDARVDLGVVYAKIGRKNDATKEFKKVLRVDPNNIIAYSHLKSL